MDLGVFDLLVELWYPLAPDGLSIADATVELAKPERTAYAEATVGAADAVQQLPGRERRVKPVPHVLAALRDGTEVRFEPRAAVVGMGNALRWPDLVGVIP